MNILSRRRKPPLTADQRDEIEAMEPVDYRAYFWQGARGWTCEIYPPVKAWGAAPPVAEARHEYPMRAFRVAFSRAAMPHEVTT